MSGKLAFLRSGLKDRLMRFSGLTGVLTLVAKTTTIFVEFGKPHPLFELAPAVRLQGTHCPGREVDLTPTTPSFGFTHGVPTAFAYEGAPYT
jgi:hypothetical protein